MGQDDDAQINDDCDREPTLGDETNSPDTQRQTSHQSYPSKRPRKKCNWNRIFSGTVALFTIVLAVVSWYQWRVMRDQLDAMKRNERPWIGFLDQKSQFTKFSIVKQGKLLHVHMEFINSGKRSARILAFIAEHEITASSPERRDYSRHFHPSSGILVPGAISFSEYDISITADSIPKIESGALTVYIFGTVLYQDLGEEVPGFPSPRYLTTTCIIYKPKTDSTDSTEHCRGYDNAT